VVLLVGRRQHLGFVDVIDPERLQDLRFDEMADARLGHDGDRDDLLDLLDLRGVRHAGDTAVSADVGRHTLEGHDGAGAGILGDLRLIGRGDVHEDAALEHLGQAGLHGEGAGLALHGYRLLRRERSASECTGGHLPAQSRTVERQEPKVTGAVNMPVGASSTNVVPDLSWNSSPFFVWNTVTSPSELRSHVPMTSLPSRSNQALPVPVTSTSGEG